MSRLLRAAMIQEAAVDPALRAILLCQFVTEIRSALSLPDAGQTAERLREVASDLESLATAVSCNAGVSE